MKHLMLSDFYLWKKQLRYHFHLVDKIPIYKFITVICLIYGTVINLINLFFPLSCTHNISWNLSLFPSLLLIQLLWSRLTNRKVPKLPSYCDWHNFLDVSRFKLTEYIHRNCLLRDLLKTDQNHFTNSSISTVWIIIIYANKLLQYYK